MNLTMKKLISLLLIISFPFSLIAAEEINEHLEKYRAKQFEEFGHTEAALKEMGDVSDTEENLKKAVEAKVEAAVTKRFSEKKQKEIEDSAASKYKLYKVGMTIKGTSGGRTVTGKIHEITAKRIRVGDHLLLRRDYPPYYFDVNENKRLRKEHVDKLFHNLKKPYEIKARRHFTEKLMKDAGYLKVRGIWRSPKNIIATVDKRCEDWLNQ